MHGDVGRYEHIEVGLNSRLDALQAAILRVKLRHLEDWTTARRLNAERHGELFAHTPACSELELPTEQRDCRHVFNQYCVRVDSQRRDQVLAELQARQVGCAVYYPKPLHLQRCFSYLAHRAGAFPESERASSEVIALPIYAELGEQRQDRVVAALAEALEQTSTRKWTVPFRKAA